MNRAASESKRFSSGSYGDWGEFYPAIAYAKSGRRRIFVRNEAVYLDEAAAVAHADVDLQLAIDQAGEGDDQIIDNLEASGYSIVDTAISIEQNTEDVGSLDEGMNKVVAAYIRAGQPPEAKAAFDRLTRLGYSRPRAFLLIKMVIIAEMWRSAHIETFPDPARMIHALNGLPELPDFMRSFASVNPPTRGSRVFA